MKTESNIISFDSTGVTESTRFLYTPCEFAKENLLYLQEAGILKSIQTHRCIRENVDSFLFFKVLEGSGTVVIQNQEYFLKSGDCVFLNCKNRYEHISSELEPWKLEWVHFNGKSAKAFFELFEQGHKKHQIFKVGKPADDIIEFLLKIPQNSSLLTDLTIGEKILQLCNIIIVAVLHSEDEDQHMRDVNEIRNFLNKHFTNKNYAKEMEQHFQSVFENLNQIFHKKYGISISNYITNRRINYVKELLRFTTKSISEIVQESGFESERILSDCFMETEGIDLDKYRMQWTQWIRS